MSTPTPLNPLMSVLTKRPFTAGILNLNKPQGLTSHDVVAHIRKLTGIRRVGHTGTLDPLATGVLVVCIGQATRLIEYMMPGHKKYRAVIRLGQTTDTLDSEGQILERRDTAHLSESDLRHLLPRFQGEIEQIPPLFSALKRRGRPLYKSARAGRQVELEPRPVTIHALEWVDWSPPDLTLEVTCSAGTYLRSLARDLGEAARTGACLIELTRTANHGYRLDEAVPLDTLVQETEIDPAAWQKYLYPLDDAVQHLPKVVLDEAAASDVKHGRSIFLIDHPVEPADDLVDNQPLRAYDLNHNFIAILTPVEAKGWQPKKVFQT